MIKRVISKLQDIAYATGYGALNGAAMLLPSMRGRRQCNMCGKSAALFYRHGEKSPVFSQVRIVGGGVRKDSVCPNCHCIDRYRWVYYVLEHFTDVMTAPCKVLHIAAEAGVAQNIRSRNPQCDYLTGDLQSRHADIKVDVTDMSRFEDETFDYIIMNHVLEHVPDEAKAMSEIKRCLKKDGRAMLSFPMCLDQKTFEDKSIVSEKERLIRYGQRDHCRLYGYDAGERLEGYGFKVTAYTAGKCLDAKDVERMGLIPEDTIYLCAKAD